MESSIPLFGENVMSDLSAAAVSLGFELSPAEREAFPSLVAELLAGLSQLPPAPRREVSGRTWHLPSKEEDPLNAFAAVTDIRGTGTGPLAGLRVALKDNIALAGVPMGNGTKLLDGFVATEDAPVVQRILAAGATIVGKTNCECLCASGASFTGRNGPVLNPWDHARSAGGSSSGSAVAVATGQADLSVGGDQGGSIRVPAALCGLVGLKPTFGRVPYAGIATVDPSLDHAGPIARTARQAARLLSVIAGPDPRDPRSRRDLAVDDWELACDTAPAGLRIAVVREGFAPDRADPEIAEVVKDALDRLRREGAVVSERNVPLHAQAVAAWMPVILYGTLAGLWTDGAGFGLTRDGMAPMVAHLSGWQKRSGELSDVLRILLLGAEMARQRFGFEPYLRGHQLGRELSLAYDEALSRADVLAMPTVAKPAGKLPGTGAGIAERFAAAVETTGNVSPFNLTGHPAISVPCGMRDGLPVGLMFVARHGDEAALFRAAAAVEAVTPPMDFPPFPPRRPFQPGEAQAPKAGG